MQEASANLRMRLDDYLARSPAPMDAARKEGLVALLRSQAVGTDGRAFILDSTGAVVASSAPDGDPVVASAMAGLAEQPGVGHVRRRDGVPVRPRDGEAALAGNVADLRDDLS